MRRLTTRLASRLASAAAQPRAAVRARSTHASAFTPAATVAALVVGDELLEGAITDTNTPWLAQLVASRGAALVEAATVRDDERTIAAAAARLASLADCVVVAGGIGPTHDDVTYAALAGDAGLKRHEGTVARMTEHYARRGVPLHAGRLRMADLPANADDVLATPDTWVPLVRVGACWIVPGVPSLSRSMLSHHAPALFAGAPTLTATLITPVGEGDVAQPLRQVAGAVREGGVKIGSYILSDDDAARGRGFNVRLKVRAKQADALEAAVAAVAAAVPGAVREEG